MPKQPKKPALATTKRIKKPAPAKPPVCKLATECTKEELEQIVMRMQLQLFADCSAYPPEGIEPNQLYWDPEKEWDSAADFMESVASTLDDFGLIPTAVGPVED